MSDPWTVDLLDLDAYLARTGASAEPPGVDALARLQLAHALTFPFDNLDVHTKGLTPSLEASDLFDKMVRRKRGGYCFELNGLFAALLRELGFQVMPVMGRVLIRPLAHYLITHRANIVLADGHRYLADVGFGGPMPAFAPLLEDGATRTEQSHTFTLHRCDDYWWEVGYRGAKEEERGVLRICEMPVEEHDFIPLSFYQSQNPQSAFRLNRMANIKTRSGAFDLRNSTFTVFDGEKKVVREIQDEGELDRLLEEYFGICDWR